MKLRLSLLLFLLSMYAFTQNSSIEGRVIDANTELPIEFANIILMKDDVFVKGTSTNETGGFEFEGLFNDTYVIRISYIGYADFEQIVILTGDLDLKNLKLKGYPESLDEVTIIATKPTITKKPDRLVFNIENTALVEGSTLGVLKNTPGVIVSDAGINIKSAPATVFINNRRVQLTTEELIQLLDNSPANSIKSIEVITNPPASYDADSGSVINIVMSKNLITGYRGNIATNFTQGVFPRYNASTSHFFKNDKINLNLNYSFSKNKTNRDNDDAVDFLNSGGAIEQLWLSKTNRNTWVENHNLNMSFDYFLTYQSTLSLTSTALYTPYFKYQINNKTNIFDADGNFISSFNALNTSRDNKYNIGTDLIFSHNFKNEASLSINGHFTVYDYEREQDVFQDELTDDDSDFNTLANQETHIYSGKVDYSLPIGDSSSFETGAKFSNVNTDSDITRLNNIGGSTVIDEANTDAFKYDESVFAAYANYSKSWDKWDLNVGLRAEQTNIEGESVTLSTTNTQDYLNVFPTLSVSHQLTDDVSISGNYKRSIVRPSYTNLNPFTLFLNENTRVLGNPNLLPTYIDDYKIGVEFLRYFTVEAYYMNFDGDIAEIPRQNNDTNIIEWTPVNLDNKVDYGFDFSCVYYPSRRYGFSAVLSIFNVNEEANFGNEVVELNQWSQLFIFTPYLSLLKDYSLNINANFWYVNKQLQNLQTIENQLISSINISKTILNKKGVLTLSVEDIFNMQDFDVAVNYLNQSSRGFMDLDNRFVKLGFRYNFGNTKLSTNERATEAEERDRIKDLD
ncbi:outer membrane beta-barrel family protein [Winogradskyella sp.]|uniref:TonB-dependent receptor domain-containing protein n=1 Tax=Winogradskyella sp. TaxID=1883156 RepID=UPI0025FF107C|nr:outer membrane beta-barrel family protein [Winogradskyella sp.]